MSRKWLALIVAGVAAIAVVVVIVVVAGGDDDGSGVRTIGCDPSSSASATASDSGSASGSGSASVDPCASASASASGLSASDLGESSDDPELIAAVDEYRTYVNDQVAETIAATTVFTDAVRAGDLDAARAAYAPSRAGWERIEPIAGLVEEIDGAVDARVDDFAGVDDPEFTGWHRLEYLVFAQDTTAGAAEFADRLDADLQTLEDEIADVEITPLAMARGASELIEEVSEGKITGEEDRYSGTDIWDIAANVEGAEKVIELLTPALERADPDLLTEIGDSFTKVRTTVAGYATADGGYQPFAALTPADTAALKASLAKLSEELAEVPGALGLK
jgi:iron uptake system component EfeO